MAAKSATLQLHATLPKDAEGISFQPCALPYCVYVHRCISIFRYRLLSSLDARREAWPFLDSKYRHIGVFVV